MTVLRRMAQLVNDLRELSLIEKDDKIACYRNEDGNFVFGVTLDHFSQRNLDVRAIKNAVVEEFPKEAIDMALNEGEIYYEINPQKS